MVNGQCVLTRHINTNGTEKVRYNSEVLKPTEQLSGFEERVNKSRLPPVLSCFQPFVRRKSLTSV
jgi:hypothetical protein